MNKTKTVLVFLICGLAAGSCLGALLRSPRLLTFWFIKGSKFLIPTYRYYAAVGFFLLLGLALGFAICRIVGLIRQPPNNAILRKTFSAMVVATSAVSIFAIASRIVIEAPVTTYLVSLVAFVLLISFACWVLTARLYYVGVFLNLLTLPLAFALLYVAARILTVPSEWSELITYPIYYSVLSSSCGFWIASSGRSEY